MLGLMLLTSKGAAGVTGSGFVALVASAHRDARPAGGRCHADRGIDRFMSEALALTSTISNALACIVVSKWERACNNDVLLSELAQGYKEVEALQQDIPSVPMALPTHQTAA